MYLVNNYISICLKKLLTYQYFSFESVHGVKEMEFFVMDGIKLVKMHSDATLNIHLAVNMY